MQIGGIRHAIGCRSLSSRFDASSKTGTKITESFLRKRIKTKLRDEGSMGFPELLNEKELFSAPITSINYQTIALEHITLSPALRTVGNEFNPTQRSVEVEPFDTPTQALWAIW